MRLIGIPGGTRSQLRGALLTMPFDLAIPLLSTGTPERTYSAGPRGEAFHATARGQTFEAPPRGKVFDAGGR